MHNYLLIHLLHMYFLYTYLLNMFLLDFSEEAVHVSNENLRRGDRVRVIKGDFAGIEGELVRIKGHKRVVVRLEGLFSLATTYIPGSFLEKIDL